jgi:hypothetical protein
MGLRKRKEPLQVAENVSRTYRVTVERVLYVTAKSRDDAKNKAFYEIKPSERVTGAVEDWW